MDALGINLLNIIVYSVLFLIIFLVLKIFFVPKMEKALEDRQKEIAKGLKFSEETDQLRQDIETEKEKVLTQARSQKKEILAASKKQADEEYKTLISQAKEKSNQIIADAQNIISMDNEKVKSEIDTQVNKKILEKLGKLAQDGKIKVNIDKII
ncbi:MAG: ATP synthase F0 subunit B [Candidatus Shapirobacteria bacterium]|nr:ATP synthase F0 subunit B [Candidatus Shapirobacteria bacterium]